MALARLLVGRLWGFRNPLRFLGDIQIWPTSILCVNYANFQIIFCTTIQVHKWLKTDLILYEKAKQLIGAEPAERSDEFAE